MQLYAPPAHHARNIGLFIVLAATIAIFKLSAKPVDLFPFAGIMVSLL